MKNGGIVDLMLSEPSLGRCDRRSETEGLDEEG
jgi:hypothetical protein